MSIHDLLLRIIAYFGHDKQMVVCIEEMAELTQALSKFIIDHPKKSRANIVEEFSDVEIMLDQIALIFDLKRREIEEAKRMKYARLEIAIAQPQDKPT